MKTGLSRVKFWVGNVQMRYSVKVRFKIDGNITSWSLARTGLSQVQVGCVINVLSSAN